MKFVLVSIVVAIFLALFSLIFEGGISDEVRRYYCAIGPPVKGNCLFPPVTGGFPFAYAFDVDGISVTDSIGPEDTFRFFPFLLNIWVYFLILLGIFIAIRQEVIRHKKK